MEKPRRRWEIKIGLSADTWEDVWSTLGTIVADLRLEGPANPLNVVSGGPSSSYVIDGDEDTEMSHERYFEELKRAIDEERDNPPSPPVFYEGCS